MVEGLDDFRSRQVRLQELRGRGRFIRVWLLWNDGPDIVAPADDEDDEDEDDADDDSDDTGGD
jgi:hypothetical protein